MPRCATTATTNAPLAGQTGRPSDGSRPAQGCQVGPEARVRDSDAVRTLNVGALAERACECEEHCHAVIAIAVGSTRPELRGLNAPAVLGCLDFAAKCRQS